MSTVLVPAMMEMPADVLPLRWEHVACNLCGRDETETYHHERLPYFGRPVDFTLVRCRRCGLVYTNPRLAEPNTTYEHIGRSDEMVFERHARQKADVFSRAIRRIGRVLGDSKKHPERGLRLLDVGSGSGHFLAAARQTGFRVCGLEPAPAPAKYAIAKFNLDVIQKDVLDADFEPACFDVITLWDVLEHVADPKAVLRRCARWLADGGILACRFPSARWQKFKAVVFHRLMRWNRPVFSPTMHNYFFDAAPFAELVRQAGLSAVSIRTTALEANTDNQALNAVKRAINPVLSAAGCLGLHLGNLEAYCRGKQP